MGVFRQSCMTNVMTLICVSLTSLEYVYNRGPGSLDYDVSKVLRYANRVVVLGVFCPCRKKARKRQSNNVTNIDRGDFTNRARLLRICVCVRGRSTNHDAKHKNLSSCLPFSKALYKIFLTNLRFCCCLFFWRFRGESLDSFDLFSSISRLFFIMSLSNRYFRALAKRCSPKPKIMTS